MKKGHEQVEKTLEMKKWSRNGKLIKQGIGMCIGCSHNVIHLNAWVYTLRYNIKGSVATSRAMPTPFFFSRLPEALRGLMTKQTPFMHT